MYAASTKCLTVRGEGKLRNLGEGREKNLHGRRKWMEFIELKNQQARAIMTIITRRYKQMVSR